MCVCVCLHICVCEYTYTYVWLYVHVYVSIFTHPPPPQAGYNRGSIFKQSLRSFEFRVYIYIYIYIYMSLYIYIYIYMRRVFANGLEDCGSIPGWVIPMTQKIVLDSTLLNSQHYKVGIKGKVVQSREWSSILAYTSV